MLHLGPRQPFPCDVGVVAWKQTNIDSTHAKAAECTEHCGAGGVRAQFDAESAARMTIDCELFGHAKTVHLQRHTGDRLAGFHVSASVVDNQRIHTTIRPVGDAFTVTVDQPLRECAMRVL